MPPVPDDLKFFEVSGGATPQMVPAIWPDTARVSGVYSVAQKVVKSLLSAPGEFASDPEYGADLARALFPVPGQAKEQARTIASAVLRKVLLDVTNPSAPDDERVLDLRLLDITYDYASTGWVLSVEIETAAGLAAITVPAAERR